MNVLLFTTLFPNNIQHRHGVFIENRMKELVQRYPDVKVKVVAPVPYFPSWLPVSDYKKYSNVAFQEQRCGVDVLHPQYWVIPKVGMNITPYFLYHASVKALTQVIESGFIPDIIDAHYFYPDGVVAQWLGEKFNIPVMVTARGSDINYIPQNNIAAKRIQRTLMQAQSTAAVSQALKKSMQSIAPQAKPPNVLRNGVDLTVFKPDVPFSQQSLVIEPHEKLVLSVGNLIELKGHHLVIEAVALLENTKLAIVGDGEMRKELEALVITLGLNEKVLFIGNIQQQALIEFYANADLLVLASSREGMPNVLLESLACGTPVVATKVGGCEEVVTDPIAGQLIEQRTVANIASAIKDVLNRNTPCVEVREFAKQFSWDETSRLQYELFKQTIANYRGEITAHG